MPPAASRQPAIPTRPPRPRPRLFVRLAGGWLASAVAAVGAAAVLVLVGWVGPAVAQTADPTLGQVIDRLRTVLVGLLVGLATLFLTLRGVRYLFAGGDPGQVEKAKITLRSAAIGYGLAALAPALVRLLRYVVGA